MLRPVKSTSDDVRPNRERAGPDRAAPEEPDLGPFASARRPLRKDRCPRHGPWTLVPGRRVRLSDPDCTRGRLAAARSALQVYRATRRTVRGGSTASPPSRRGRGHVRPRPRGLRRLDACPGALRDPDRLPPGRPRGWELPVPGVGDRRGGAGAGEVPGGRDHLRPAGEPDRGGDYASDLGARWRSVIRAADGAETVASIGPGGLDPQSSWPFSRVTAQSGALTMPASLGMGLRPQKDLAAPDEDIFLVWVNPAAAGEPCRTCEPARHPPAAGAAVGCLRSIPAGRGHPWSCRPSAATRTR